MLGYLSDNHLESKEELENAKLQRAELIKNEKKLEADIARLSIKYKKAIDDKNEDAIDECRTEMAGKSKLWDGVRDSLSKKQLDYIYSLNEKAMDERKIKKETKKVRKKQARNKRFYLKMPHGYLADWLMLTESQLIHQGSHKFYMALSLRPNGRK